MDLVLFVQVLRYLFLLPSAMKANGISFVVSFKTSHNGSYGRRNSGIKSEKETDLNLEEKEQEFKSDLQNGSRELLIYHSSSSHVMQ